MAQRCMFGGPVPIHMICNDRSGQSLSVEYIKGELNMLDGPTGAHTNDPPFPHHPAAAGNYGNLSAMPPAEMRPMG